MTVSGAPALDPPAIDRLRAALDAAGYTAETVKELLGEDAFESRGDAVPVLVRRLDDDSIGTIVRLFFLGQPVPERSLTGMLPPTSELAALGLVATAGDDVRPLVRIVPHEELMVAADLYATIDDPPDYVAGSTGSGAIASALTVRRPARRALDVGTGSGVQALLAARHSEQVVATDVNPRALAFTEFNARLNRLEHVETREGSLCEPVEGERFDLLVCNAPYVISPDTRFAYRDAGRRGDEFSAEVVRSAAAHLEDDGFATLQVSWLGGEGEEWHEQPVRWVDGLGCDAWIVLSNSRPPLVHAASWNADERHQPEVYAATLDRWTAYAREVGAKWIAEGVIVLRRRTGARNWVRVDQPSGEAHEQASDQILRIFGAMNVLSAWDDRTRVLDQPFRLAESVRVDQTFAVRGEGRAILSTRVRLDEGVRFSADVSPETAELLALLEKRGTLGAALAELAERLSLDAESVRRLTAQAAEIVADMWASGYLRPREGSPEEAP